MEVEEITIRTCEVEQHRETAYEVSTTTLMGGADQVIDEVRYIVIWKREGGEWKMHRDIFNSSRPTQ